MLIAMALIFMILIYFSSIPESPHCYYYERKCYLALAGVFLRLCCIWQDLLTGVMSGIGLVALAGIVVRNGILTIEFNGYDAAWRHDAI
jgi:multidrug efflux pump subunit AcrB